MKNEIVPLSRDLELRPRRDPSTISTSKMLRPILRESIDHIGNSLTRLGEMADRACREDNPIIEAQLRAKLAELGTRLLNLERSSLGEEPPLSQEDLPDWSALPEKVRDNFEKGMDEMKVRFGPDWWEHWNLGRLSETDEHITGVSHDETNRSPATNTSRNFQSSFKKGAFNYAKLKSTGTSKSTFSIPRTDSGGIREPRRV